MKETHNLPELYIYEKGRYSAAFGSPESGFGLSLADRNFSQKIEWSCYG
jgi:hypothetical protein